MIFKHGMSANTLHRIKNGKAITTKTLDTLCFILDCSVSDIFYIDTSVEAPIYCAPLKSQIQFTNYYPQKLIDFEAKCQKN